jgi:polyisoprenoid-binding protein YceI
MPIFFQVISSTRVPRKAWIILLFAIASLRAGVLHADQILPLDPADSAFHFTGDSFLHTFHGEAKEITGSATVDRSANPPIQKATLAFKSAELTTFNQERDDKMKQWMAVGIHPEVDFALEKVTPISGDYGTATALHPARFGVSGTLTLNAVKRQIAGEALGWREKDRLVVTGDIVVNTLNFGLPQIRMVVITVAPDVKTSYRFSFKLPPELALK